MTTQSPSAPLDNSPIQLVVFDLGRVLVGICDGWADACALAGAPLPDLNARPNVGVELARLGYEHEIGRLDIAAFVEQTARFTGLTPAQVRAVSDIWLRGAYPGTHALLRDVAMLPVRSACLSNTNDNHWRLMTTAAPGNANYLGLEHLTYRFASHLIGHAKPDPATYQHVEAATGVPPYAILFFDDNAANIAVARRRGWNAHQVAPAADPPQQLRTVLRQQGVL